VEEGGGFAGEGGGDGEGAGGNVEPLGRGEGLELAGGFELGVLLGGWVLGRAHGFPDGEGVGVGVVDAKVFDEDPVDGGGDAGDFDGDLGVRCGQVGVVGLEDGGRGIVDRADGRCCTDGAEIR